MVERLAQPEVLAQRLEAAVLAQGHEHFVAVAVVAERLGLLAHELLDLGVRHVQRQPVGDRVEHELAGDRALRLVLKPRDELLGLLPGHGEKRLERDAARLDLAGEAGQQLTCARLDERPGGLHLGGGDERVGRVGAEPRLDLVLDLLTQARLDVRLQLGERLELRRGAGEVVVERRQHLLLDLLDRGGEGLRRPVGELERHLLRLAGVHADEALLDLLHDRAAAEIDDVVAPRLVLGHEVDHHRVLGSDRPVVDGNELGDRRPQRVELVLHELLRHLDLGDADLELLPVGQLGLRLHRDGRGELPVLVLGGRQLEVELRLGHRAHAGARGRVPEPAADVALDGLGHQPLAAEALHEDLRGTLPLRKPGILTLCARSSAACSTAW